MRVWAALVIGAIMISLTKPGGVSFGVERVARAIAVAEGYGVPGAIPTVRNNPGNIRSKIAPDYPIAYYPSVEAGWDALYKQVRGMLNGTSPYYPKGSTLEQVARTYTGEAQYMNWARNVARVLGVSTLITFSDLA